MPPAWRSGLPSCPCRRLSWQRGISPSLPSLAKDPSASITAWILSLLLGFLFVFGFFLFLIKEKSVRVCSPELSRYNPLGLPEDAGVPPAYT